MSYVSQHETSKLGHPARAPQHRLGKQHQFRPYIVYVQTKEAYATLVRRRRRGLIACATDAGPPLEGGIACAGGETKEKLVKSDVGQSLVVCKFCGITV